MTYKKCCFIVIVFFCQFILAQNDSIIKLKEVIITDVLLEKFNKSQLILKLNDSVNKKNQASLTSLLNYNSFIYFKENGFGMVASPSFRGTTAQQTAVIWNGININSQLNGQTDFNTISTRNFDTIEVKPGGGSAIYGSSAIGGSIHLNNNLNFNTHFTNELQINYGSFNSLDINYNTKLSCKKFSSHFGFSRNTSDNDYAFLGTNKINTNGEFYNSTYNLNLGFKLNKFNYIYFYGQLFNGNRNLSGTLATISNANYRDSNSRSLMEWTRLLKKYTSKIKLAYLTENYNYFEDKNSTNFASGTAESIILRHESYFEFNKNIELNMIIDLSQNKGFGENFGQNTRNIGAFVLLLKHQVLPKFMYEFSVRNEITNVYKSPVLFAMGTKYELLKNYFVKTNVSKNYRIPSFNDLYWVGLGNINLVPETSVQYEIGQEIKLQKFTLSAIAYAIQIDNLIQWSPKSNGIWRPNNTKNVTSKGLEFASTFSETFQNASLLFNCNYARTISTDDDLQTQLIYVPLNKITASTSLQYKRLSTDIQFLYNGNVYTKTDNTAEIPGFKVFNFLTNYNFGGNKNYKIGFQIRNIFNENYQNVASRPMPGRNFTINFNLLI